MNFANKGHTAEEFKRFWLQGFAEISRFELEQVRYGEIHKGDAVLIYVTEEFLIDKQVKSEQGKISITSCSVPILWTKRTSNILLIRHILRMISGHGFE